MAESIIIHCGKHANMFTNLINKRFGEAPEQMWYFPKNEYLVMITPYTDYDTEYEPSEQAEVLSKLGEAPSISYDFEIRRSRSDEACDLLEDFIRNDLKGLSFIVDDMQRILSQN